MYVIIADLLLFSLFAYNWKLTTSIWNWLHLIGIDSFEVYSSEFSYLLCSLGFQLYSFKIFDSAFTPSWAHLDHVVRALYSSYQTSPILWLNWEVCRVHWKYSMHLIVACVAKTPPSKFMKESETILQWWALESQSFEGK